MAKVVQAATSGPSRATVQPKTAAGPSPVSEPSHTRNGHGTTNGATNGSTNGSHTRAPSRMHDSSKDLDTAVKHFVLDTNVLLHNPDAVFVFQENHVVIPFAVIEELDKMKRKDDDLGRNARACIRHLDRLRAVGHLNEGVNWGLLGTLANTANSAGANGTGTVKIDVEDYTRPTSIALDSPDNRIIAVAWHLKEKGHRTVFVTKDLAARIKADALGIKTEDFTNQKVDADRLYTGYLTADLEGAMIDELYHDRLLAVDRLAPALVRHNDDTGEDYQQSLEPNQYVVLKDKDDENHTGLGRRLADTDHVIPVTGPRKPVFGIMARNVQQTMALDALLDEEVKLITLLGSAGTGKTLLALAAGMVKVFNEERYEKLLVARPIMPLGRDIGYLPGDKDEKLTAWMQPIFDNLSYLLSTRGSPQSAESHSTEQRINKLMADGKLVLEPLTYIRGRSIPHQFMIVDEAQNLTPHEVKTIASRVGEGTKLILTGDIGQIDNPYLDSSSNGLAYAVEKMKGVRLFAHVTLAKSERSELASLAASRL